MYRRELIKLFMMFLLPIGLPIYMFFVDKSDWFFDKETAVALISLQFAIITFSMLIDSSLSKRKTKTFRSWLYE